MNEQYIAWPSSKQLCAEEGILGVINYGRLPGGGKHGAEKEEIILRTNGPCVEVGKQEMLNNLGAQIPLCIIKSLDITVFQLINQLKSPSISPPRAPLQLFFFLTSFLEYNCFTMVCQCLLYNKVNHLYIYIYPHISFLLCLPPTLPIPPLQVVTKHRADLPVLCGCFPLAFLRIHDTLRNRPIFLFHHHSPWPALFMTFGSISSSSVRYR